MMPALSPFMTEGTVTRWTKQEGDAFEAGDVLLQIENDVGMVDVEALASGYMGKILTPAGTSHVPVESVIAIVARNQSELAAIQSQSLAATPPPYSSTPTPPSASFSFSPSWKSSSPLSTPMTARTPSLFEMHSMGHGSRSAHVGSFRNMGSNALGSPVPWPVTPLEDAPHSPRPKDGLRTPLTARFKQSDISDVSEPSTPKGPRSAMDVSYPKGGSATEDSQLDGEAIKRMIISNLSSSTMPDQDLEEFV